MNNYYKECTIKGTPLCDYLGSEGCEKCNVRQASDQEMKEIAKSWETTLSLLPDDVDTLHMSDKCLFCKKQENSASCYVLLDMVHPEPKYMRGIFFGYGKKVSMPIGSLVQLPVACCESCRRHLKMRDRIGFCIPAAAAILAIILVFAVPNLRMFDVRRIYIPVAFILCFSAVGFIAGSIALKAYDKNILSKTHLNIWEIPVIKRMMDAGWSYFVGYYGLKGFVFSDKKPKPHMMLKKRAATINMDVLS